MSIWDERTADADYESGDPTLDNARLHHFGEDSTHDHDGCSSFDAGWDAARSGVPLPPYERPYRPTREEAQTMAAARNAERTQQWRASPAGRARLAEIARQRGLTVAEVIEQADTRGLPSFPE